MYMKHTTKFLFLFLFSSVLLSQSNAQSLSVTSQFGIKPSLAGARNVSIAVDEYTGKQVYVWAQQDAGGWSRDIYCNIYDRNMNEQTGAFVVNKSALSGAAGGDQTDFSVRINSYDGSFVIAWGSSQSGTYDVYVKKIQLDLSSTTAALVASATDNPVQDPALLAGDQSFALVVFHEASGELLVGYQGPSGVSGVTARSVYYQRINYSTMSRIGSQVQINTAATLSPGSMKMEYCKLTGQIITTYDNWASGCDVMRRLIDYDVLTGLYSFSTEINVASYTAGDQMTSGIAVNQNTGAYSISWLSYNQNKTGRSIVGKIFTSTHAVIKSDFFITTKTADEQIIIAPVWDEKSNVITYFWLNMQGTLYRVYATIFDGNNATPFSQVGGDSEIISDNNGGAKIAAAIYGPNHTIYVAYGKAVSSNESLNMAIIKYAHPSFNPALSAAGNKNWVDTKTFNASGDMVSESRSFYDNEGDLLQTQWKDAENPTTVFASMPLYDYLDRPAIQTLPGVVNTSGSFSYDSYFSNVIYANPAPKFAYQAAFWDTETTINNPVIFGKNYGLGKYYSVNNTNETGVPNTSYPYSRTFFNDAAPGGVVKQAGVGDAHRMGAGHEVKAIELPVFNELDHYAILRKTHFVKKNNGTADVNAVSTLQQRATKQVIIDENGNNKVVFTDLSGNTIATARFGNSPAAPINSSVTLLPNYYSCNFTYAPLATTQFRGDNLRVFCSSTIEVFDQETAVLLFSGAVADFQSELFSNPIKYAVDYLHVRSKEFFRVKLHYTNLSTNAESWETYKADYYNGQSSIDVQLYTGHGLAINAANAAGATIQIQNLETGAIVYSGVATANFTFIVDGIFRITYLGLPFIALPFTSQNSYQNYPITITFKQFLSEWSYNFYDDAGRLIAKTAPNGISSLTNYALPQFTDTYTYTNVGQLLSSTEVDAGTTNYVYCVDGRLRFSQNAEQAIVGNFSFVNYDEEYRVAKTGEYDKTVSGAALVFQTQKQYDVTVASATVNPQSIIGKLNLFDINSNGGMGAYAYLSDYNIIYYGNIGAYTMINALNVGIGTVTSRNVWNKVSQTVNKAGYTTVCSYDNEYNMEWTVQTLPGLGSKKIDYVYNEDHQLLQTTYQKNDLTDRFEHMYTYDKIGRVKSVLTREATGAVKLQEKHYYYLHGPLKRKELAGNLQGIDYVYTIQGWLKGINHHELNTAKDPGKDGNAGTPNGGFAPDAFGISFDYFNGDYSNSTISYATPGNMTSFGTMTTSTDLQGNLYDGTIRSVCWLNAASPNAGNNPNQLSYNYNKGQLILSTYGVRNLVDNQFVRDNNDKFYTYIDYDLNGNITSNYGFKLNAVQANVVQIFDYNYTANTNKLASISSSGDSGGNRGYVYNAIGQMVQQTDETGIKKITYNPAGLVKNVKDGANKLRIAFEYDEKGKRAKKASYDINGNLSNVTWYVHDAIGNEVSIYDTKSTPTPVQTEVPIYGASRTGIYKKVYNPSSPYALSSTSMVYELKDHLGNVRVTIDRNKVGNAAHVLMWADYHAFGEVMQGSQMNNPNPALNDRYGYQGEYAECDEETGWNSFDLRMYDPVIGRWLSKDPYNQYHSPYVGMGNDPVSGVDPDGGYKTRFGAWTAGVWAGKLLDRHFGVTEDLDGKYFYSYGLKDDIAGVSIRAVYGDENENYLELSYDLSIGLQKGLKVPFLTKLEGNIASLQMLHIEYNTIDGWSKSNVFVRELIITTGVEAEIFETGGSFKQTTNINGIENEFYGYKSSEFEYGGKTEGVSALQIKTDNGTTQTKQKFVGYDESIANKNIIGAEINFKYGTMVSE